MRNSEESDRATQAARHFCGESDGDPGDDSVQCVQGGSAFVYADTGGGAEGLAEWDGVLWSPRAYRAWVAGHYS
jgi:hypothetical protein